MKYFIIDIVACFLYSLHENLKLHLQLAPSSRVPILELIRAHALQRTLVVVIKRVGHGRLRSLPWTAHEHSQIYSSLAGIMRVCHELPRGFEPHFHPRLEGSKRVASWACQARDAAPSR